MNPYLSIVMGVGGVMSADLLQRLNNSTRNTLALAGKHKLSMELVIVEWRTPASVGCPSVLTAVTWPTSDIPVRVIHVPSEVHQGLPNPHGFKYFEWYPKNVGIRRSQGRFVLSTNPDDLYSEELIAYLAQEKLEEGWFYRVNRHDTQDGKVFRICRSNGTFPPTMSEEETHRVRNYVNAVNWHPNAIHYNASGDFTMMSRADWFRIRGNPEQPYNNSVDGQTLYLARLNGIQQVILPYPIYHPDHVRTLNHAYCPSWDDNHPHTKQNGEEWGLRDKTFQETTIRGTA